MTIPFLMRVPAARIAHAFLVALVAVVVLIEPSAAAGAPEHWRATSTTAESITGDVIFTPTRITFQNGRALPLTLVEHVSGFKGMDETVDAAVYRVTIPGDPVLKNENRLCGAPGRPVLVTYIAVWVPSPLPGDKAPRSMAAFSGKSAPRAAEGDTLCGIYNYESGD